MDRTAPKELVQMVMATEPSSVTVNEITECLNADPGRALTVRGLPD